MSKPSKVAMSSIFPKALRQKTEFFLESHLSPKVWTALQGFWIQTRLIFSKSILLLVVALFAVFAFQGLGKVINQESRVVAIVTAQSIILAVLMSMNLWATERESQTYELLLMRVPNLDSLIWLKLCPVLIWAIILSFPFFLGFGWFVSIPALHLVAYFFFAMTLVLFTVLLTCVVSTFVRVGLASGIVSVIILWMIIIMSMEMRFPFVSRYYYQLPLNPFDPDFDRPMAAVPRATVLKYCIVNRILLLTYSAGLYAWLRRRLGKTEKWIG